MGACHAAGCLVLGHRGAPMEQPENTLEAFAAAADAGADGIELDVRYTKDGEMVVSHDASLERQAGVAALVPDLDLEELRHLDAAWGFDPDGDASFPLRGQGVRIPTLREALDLAAERHLVVNVEVKNLPGDPGYREAPDVALAAADLVLARGEANRVFLSSFNLLDVVAVHRSRPDICVAWLTLPALPAEEVLEIAGARDIRCVHPHVDALAGDAARTFAAAADWVAAWTVDDQDEACRLAAAGVSAVITNRPGALRAALTSRGWATST